MSDQSNLSGGYGGGGYGQQPVKPRWDAVSGVENKPVYDEVVVSMTGSSRRQEVVSSVQRMFQPSHSIRYYV